MFLGFLCTSILQLLHIMHQTLIDIGVSCEISFSALKDRLHREDQHIVSPITKVVDEYLKTKTAKRLAEGKDKLPDYYRNFALLWKLTKFVRRSPVTLSLTVAHTSSVLSEYYQFLSCRIGSGTDRRSIIRLKNQRRWCSFSDTNISR